MVYGGLKGLIEDMRRTMGRFFSGCVSRRMFVMEGYGPVYCFSLHQTSVFLCRACTSLHNNIVCLCLLPFNHLLFNNDLEGMI